MQESNAIVTIVLGVVITVSLCITAYNMFPPEMESITCSCGGLIKTYSMLIQDVTSFNLAHARCIGN